MIKRWLLSLHAYTYRQPTDQLTTSAGPYVITQFGLSFGLVTQVITWDGEKNRFHENGRYSTESIVFKTWYLRVEFVRYGPI